MRSSQHFEASQYEKFPQIGDEDFNFSPTIKTEKFSQIIKRCSNYPQMRYFHYKLDNAGEFWCTISFQDFCDRKKNDQIFMTTSQALKPGTQSAPKYIVT